MKKRASKVKIPLLMKINNDAKAEKEAEQNPKKIKKKKIRSELTEKNIRDSLYKYSRKEYATIRTKHLYSLNVLI